MGFTDYFRKKVSEEQSGVRAMEIFFIVYSLYFKIFALFIPLEWRIIASLLIVIDDLECLSSTIF